MDAIRFYRVEGEHGHFSNFSPHPVRMKGRVWPTSEHYFQAMKYAGTPREEEIRRATGPGQAARLGRDRKHKLRADWEAVKDGVMYEVVMAKFTQHEDLRAALLATGDAVLVEHTENDAYWGDGGDGRGRNMLGRTLMRVRDELRAGG